MIKKIQKGNPLWVRSGKGTKKHGMFHWEYQKNGKYYAEGFYNTAQDAHEACISHQEWMAKFENPDSVKALLVYDDKNEEIT